MGSKEDIEKLYWNLEQGADIIEQGDFSAYYAHLENVLTAGVKKERGERYTSELSPSYRKYLMVI